MADPGQGAPPTAFLVSALIASMDDCTALPGGGLGRRRGPLRCSLVAGRASKWCPSRRL
jgi:hypothetical protein